MLKKLTFAALATTSLLLQSTSQAATIDFGVSWPSLDTGDYSSTPLNRVLKAQVGKYSSESEIATFVNGVLVTSFAAGDILKTEKPNISEEGGSDGYFVVPSGYTYLIVQYGGPAGGAVLIHLDGNDAKVPFDSSMLWGDGDKYAVSHYSVIRASTPATTEVAVPDGGATAALLGLGLTGVGCVSRRLKQRRS